MYKNTIIQKFAPPAHIFKKNFPSRFLFFCCISVYFFISKIFIKKHPKNQKKAEDTITCFIILITLYTFGWVNLLIIKLPRGEKRLFMCEKRLFMCEKRLFMCH